MKGVLVLISIVCCVGHCKMTGGWTPADKDAANVVEVSRFVSSEIAAKNDSPCEITLVLKKAETQVVAGMNYRLQFQSYTQNCALNNGKNDEQGRICTVMVWEKSWEKFRKITSDGCSDAKTSGETGQKFPNNGQFCYNAISHERKLIGRGDHDIGHMGLFKKFVHKYSKVYRDEKEFNQRFRMFRKNMKKVKRLQETEQGTAVYGATEFADLTAEEFRMFRTGLKPRFSKVPIRPATIPDIDIPDAYDWRSYDAVTPVKNQGMCGSCWAFSVTGNIEGQWAVKKQELLSLSEQELVDCDKVDQGCNGGYMTDAYEQIIKLGGLETESDYPYEGVDDQCKFSQEKAKAAISGYVNISQDESDMAKWLTQNGPISIGINANAMQFYFGGVSHPFKFLCTADIDSLDHGVLIVGYGVSTSIILKKTLPYWIVKNSWGEYWGEQGYYRVYRGDGTCGLNLMASSAQL